MPTITTFIAGVLVGGATKWAYDKWQAQAEEPDLSAATVQQKATERAQHLRESARNTVQNVREKSAERATSLQQSASQRLRREKPTADDQPVDASTSEHSTEETQVSESEPVPEAEVVILEADETADPLIAGADIESHGQPDGEESLGLEAIHGIGSVYASVLANAGITTIDQLAGNSAEAIIEILDKAGKSGPHDVEDWLQQAATLSNS